MVLDLRSCYMSAVYDTDKLISGISQAVPSRSFDTLVGTGLSGSLAVPVIARALKKDFLVVRKPDDGSHSRDPAEGVLGDRWLFVDDFIDSGRTLQRVLSVIREITSTSGPYSSYKHTSRFVGAYLYKAGRFKTPSDLSRYIPYAAPTPEPSWKDTDNYLTLRGL